MFLLSGPVVRGTSFILILQQKYPRVPPISKFLAEIIFPFLSVLPGSRPSEGSDDDAASVSEADILAASETKGAAVPEAQSLAACEAEGLDSTQTHD